MTSLVQRDCTTCCGQREFEAPVCVVGHEADCPELACVECGEAVFLGAFGEVRAATDVLPPVAAAA